MTAEPTPVESLTPEQASAEIATHRAAPVSSLPSDERITALYQRAHAVPSSPVPAPETVGAATEKIAAIPKALTTERDDTPRYRELVAQMEEQYKALHPAVPERDPAAQAIDAAAPSREGDGPPLTDENQHAAWRATATTPRHDGQPWNRATVAQVHALMGAHLAPDIAAEYFSYALPIINGAHAEIARGLQVSPESTEALLMAEWGDEWDRKSAAADAVWAKLPKAEENQREQDRRVISASRARAAGAGIDEDFGSSLLAQMESAETAELNARRIRWSGETQAKGFQAEQILSGGLLAPVLGRPFSRYSSAPFRIGDASGDALWIKAQAVASEVFDVHPTSSTRLWP